MGNHGPFVPEGVRYTKISRDHFKVWLFVSVPGCKNRKRVFIGETRRAQTERRGPRDYWYWRAFPAGVPEFPEVFDTNVKALEYLKKRWEARSVLPTVSARLSHQPADMSWKEWLGGDPFTDR